MQKITLSGNAGTGKTTTGNLVAEKTGFKFVSVGNFAREYAEKEFRLTINEFQKKCKNNPELDELIDTKFKQFCNSNSGIVADYRLGFHFVENAFHVLLKVSDELAIQRIQNANREQENVTAGSIKTRNRLMRQRFIEKYGVDFNNEENYDLVIDTDNFSVEEIALIITNKFYQYE
jgi:predicted cytidylate kinase